MVQRAKGGHLKAPGRVRSSENTPAAVASQISGRSGGAALGGLE